MQYMLQNSQDRLKIYTSYPAACSPRRPAPSSCRWPRPLSCSHTPLRRSAAACTPRWHAPSRIVIRLSPPAAPPQTAQDHNLYSELFEKFWSQIRFHF